jgi:hypothetical protein
MRATTQKAALSSVRFRRTSTTKTSIAKSGVLIDEMCILGSTSFSKIPDLHNLWEERDVHGGLGGFGEVVTFEYFFVLSKLCQLRASKLRDTYLVECTLVPILL